jgi:putative component of membrane protein insertase Oxa1/YidC/SpoIIIJ protein YidD
MCVVAGTHSDRLASITVSARVAPLAARIGLRCRFTPSCSRYAETVIARDGRREAAAEALLRIARCGLARVGTRDDPDLVLRLARALQARGPA